MTLRMEGAAGIPSRQSSMNPTAGGSARQMSQSASGSGSARQISVRSLSSSEKLQKDYFHAPAPAPMGGGTLGRLLDQCATWRQLTQVKVDTVLADNTRALLTLLRKMESTAEPAKVEQLQRYVAAAQRCRQRSEQWALLQRRLNAPGAPARGPRDRETNLGMARGAVDEAKKLRLAAAKVRETLVATRADCQSRLDAIGGQAGVADARPEAMLLAEGEGGALARVSRAAAELTVRLRFFRELKMSDQVDKRFASDCTPPGLDSKWHADGCPPHLNAPREVRAVMTALHDTILSSLHSDSGEAAGMKAAAELPGKCVTALKQVENHIADMETKHAQFMAWTQRTAVEHVRKLRAAADFILWACAAADSYLEHEARRLAKYDEMPVQDVLVHLKELPRLAAQAEKVGQEVAQKQVAVEHGGADAARQLRTLRKQLVEHRNAWRREATGLLDAVELYPEVQKDPAASGALRHLLDLAMPLPLRSWEEFETDAELTDKVRQFTSRDNIMVARHQDSPHAVVLKAIKMPDEMMPQALRTLRVLCALEEHGIADVQAFVTQKKRGREDRFLQVPFYDNGNLEDYMQAHDGDQSVTEDVLEVFAHVAWVLASCHTHGVMHCNIKAQNLLISQPPGGGLRGVLTDFELGATEGPSSRRGRAAAGYSGPLAPEVLEDFAKRRTPAADVYALGVLMTQTLGGQPRPTTKAPGGQIELPCDSGSGGSGSLSRLVTKMLSTNPGERPSMQRVLQLLVDGKPRPRNLQSAQVEKESRKWIKAAANLSPVEWTSVPRCPPMADGVPPRSVDAPEEVYHALEGLLQHADSVRVAGVMRNENLQLWRDYAARREQISAAGSKAPSPDAATGQLGALSKLLPSPNGAAERWLFLRGARSPEAANAMMHDGVPIESVPRGMFGYGIDFTDSASAASAGFTIPEGGVASLPGNVSMCSTISGAQPGQGTPHVILLCRVCLGKCHSAQEPNPTLRAAPSGCNSIAGTVDGDRYFFVYDGRLAYPEYAVSLCDSG